MHRVAYGVVTQSIEDPSQLVLVDLDDADTVPDDVLERGQALVGLEDVLTAVRAALVIVDCSSVDDVVSAVRQEMLAGRRG